MLPPTWSCRKRLSQSNGQDVYQYDVIPLPVRIQVVQILRDGLGGYYHPYRVDHIRRCYNFIVRFLRSEFGVHSLTAFDGEDLSEVLFRWFQEVEGIDRWLDGLEASLRIIDDHVRRNWDNFQSLVSAKPDDVITEINARLQEAAIGYQYVSGNIIRIDFTFVHKEVYCSSSWSARRSAFRCSGAGISRRSRGLPIWQARGVHGRLRKGARKCPQSNWRQTWVDNQRHGHSKRIGQGSC